MNDDDKLEALVAELAQALTARRWLCATAESCTGGGVAQALTARSGSSTWFERGFVTYSNQAKQDMLGVQADTIERHGAVSEETARAMAEGALQHSRAQAAVAVTGIAGPEGGTPDKPVGTVMFGWSLQGAGTEVQRLHLDGDRQAVRQASIETAIQGLVDRLNRC